MAEELTGLKKHIADVIIAVVTSPQVKKMLGDLLTERILPILPVVAASAAKSAVDQIVDKTPGLEGVVDIVKTANETRDRLSDMLPHVNLPLIGELGDFLTGL